VNISPKDQFQQDLSRGCPFKLYRKDCIFGITPRWSMFSVSTQTTCDCHSAPPRSSVNHHYMSSRTTVDCHSASTRMTYWCFIFAKVLYLKLMGKCFRCRQRQRSTFTSHKPGQRVSIFLCRPGWLSTITRRRPGLRIQQKNPVTMELCWLKFWNSGLRHPIASQRWDVAKEKWVKSHACVPLNQMDEWTIRICYLEHGG